MAGANLGAKQIGTAYHTEQLGKAGQLLLHALLGATANAMTNDDLLSGAVSGVVGEITGDILKNHGVNKKAGTSIAGLMAGLSALLTGKLTGLTDDAISNNIYSGERLGKNAAEHNTYGATTITACSIGGPIGCTAGVTIETVSLLIGAGLLVVDSAKELYNIIDGIIGSETTVDSETTENKTTENKTTGNSIAVSGSPMIDPGDDDKNDKNDKNDKKNKEREESKNNNQKGKTSKETEDVLKDAKKDPHRGKSRIYEKGGGYEQAEKDFEKITGDKGQPTENKDTRTSHDSNGNPVNLRKESSDGRITVEIQKSKNNKIKIRYNN